MTNALASPLLAKLTTFIANAQRQLPAGRPRIARGSIVRVPSDGSIGEVTWSDGVTVRLIHGDRDLGRGPWVMLRDQLEVASAPDAAAYRERVAALGPDVD